MTTSERALASSASQGGSHGGSNQSPDRERLREEWRLAAVAHVLADDAAKRAREGLKIFYSELVGELMSGTPGMKLTTAERIALTSEAYKDYVNRMHDLRRRAAELEIVERDADRRYYEQVSTEATNRAEMRLSR